MEPLMHQAAYESPLVVASNRGPVSYRRTAEGALVGERGSGGLVTALAGVLFESDATWLSAAMSEGDREVAASGKAIEVEPTGHAAFLDVPDDRYAGYYNGIANRVLWQLHHYLFDLSYLPTWDAETRAIWSDFRDVNRLFAAALDASGGEAPVYLVQDYHLSLVPQALRELQPTARIVHFTHTPFASPSYLRVLPGEMREELLRGMLGADIVGFQAEQWAENFLLSCRDSLGDVRVDVRRKRVWVDDREVMVRSYPIALDPGPLRAMSRSREVQQIRKDLAARREGRRLLLRVDRLELSKNILRGFQAYESFLVEHPEWRGKVQFLSLLPRSRVDIPEYQVYAERCLDTAAVINERLGGKTWQPIEISTDENYPGAVAAFGLYDALLVNPMFDGMNLVAMEGPLVNRRKGVLVLSRNAGAFARLGRHSIPINPFDIAATGAALHAALEMPEEERIRRGRGLVRAVLARNPVRWLTAQLADLDELHGLHGRSQRSQQGQQFGGIFDLHIGSGREVGGNLGPEDGDTAHGQA
jgi:trehalose 6-phosphate synthase